MIDEQIFNKRIDQFLNEQPNSNASKLISKIVSEYPNYNSYFSIFDDFTFRLGMGFLNTAVLNKTDKIIGYVPQFKFYPENLISEIVGVSDLVSSARPMTRKSSMTFLTKEVIYKLMRTKNLKEIMALK